MQLNTLTPYINDAIGFLRAFCSNVSSALMSTSNHVPSSAIAARIASHHLLRMSHVVNAVERRHEIDAVIGR